MPSYDVAAQFEPTTVGVNSTFNVINWATGVQIFAGSGDHYYVAKPANARNSGVRAIASAATLQEAYHLAAEVMPSAAAAMARRHAEALRLDSEKADRR